MRAASYAAPLVLLLVHEAASAQGLPPGPRRREVVTQGRVEVTTYGFEGPTAPPEEFTDTTELKLSAGGLLSGGNAESLSLTAAGRFRVRRHVNQLSLAVAGNYGSAAAEGDDERRVNVENIQGKLRYDRFLSETFAAFLSASARRDRFQGLSLRFNLDPGLAYYLVDDTKHRLWAELGYDFQHDIRRRDAIRASAEQGKLLERSAVQHNVRLFLGYGNDLSETIAFEMGVELLQSLSHTDRWRITWDAGLTSQIAGNFSIATMLNLRYDRNPLPGFESTDYITSVSLVYQFL